MSSSKRKSTVHDLASLRLHPDGTRVSTSQSNKRRKEKHAAQDRHGNWVAQDAGGTGRVKTRRAAAKEREITSEVQGQENEHEGEGRSSVEKGKGRAMDLEWDEDEEPRGNPKPLKDRRAKLRKTFDEDMLLLGPSLSASTRGGEHEPGNATGSTPYRDPLLPSSDLLKCIHYFASTYYDAMGQLRDSSREYRREKKRRRLQRLQKQVNKEPSASKSPSSSSEDNSSDESSSSSSSEGSRSQDERSKGNPRPVKRKQNARRSASPGPDMYKVFDGSALVAIGMLLQHHVDEQLKTKVPEGWEAAMEKTERPKVRRGRPRRQEDEIVGEDEVYDLQLSDEEDQKILSIKMPMLDHVQSDDDEYTPD